VRAGAAILRRSSRDETGAFLRPHKLGSRDFSSWSAPARRSPPLFVSLTPMISIHSFDGNRVSGLANLARVANAWCSGFRFWRGAWTFQRSLFQEWRAVSSHSTPGTGVFDSQSPFDGTGSSHRTSALDGELFGGQIWLFHWQTGSSVATRFWPFGVSQTCRDLAVFFIERLRLLERKIGLESFKFKNFGTGFCWQTLSFSRLPAWTTVECMGLRRTSPTLLL
jgi:hypothetical protein